MPLFILFGIIFFFIVIVVIVVIETGGDRSKSDCNCIGRGMYDGCSDNCRNSNCRINWGCGPYMFLPCTKRCI